MRIPGRLITFIFVGLLPFFFGRSVAAAEPTELKKWEISADQEAFLNSLERDTFNFFWKTTNPQNGPTPDRYPDPAFSSIAGVGFALTAYPVGVERGYITRDQAAERTLNTLEFLWTAPQGPERSGMIGYKGFYYHFLDMDKGSRWGETELSSIDTALLVAGVLFSQSYFDRDTEVERKIRDTAEAIYRRVDWQWIYSQTHKPLLSMGWYPDNGFISYYWRGYNEAMILYILALASPTHPIEADAWKQWTSTYAWEDFYGYPHVNFGPLFGHQYSHVWIDFRGIQDDYMRSKGIDYFINSQRATYANQAYCIKNPGKWSGYDAKFWGLTASDGPYTPPSKDAKFHSYVARGVSADYTRDDGTVAPTAVGGSVPFAPEIAVPTLKNFRDEYGDRIYGEYGFKDALNLSYQTDSPQSRGWFDNEYLAIDQGPILLMIENYRTGFVWDVMKRNPHIRDGLVRAGFKGGWLNPGPSPNGGGQQLPPPKPKPGAPTQVLHEEKAPEIQSKLSLHDEVHSIP